MKKPRKRELLDRIKSLEKSLEDVPRIRISEKEYEKTLRQLTESFVRNIVELKEEIKDLKVELSFYRENKVPKKRKSKMEKTVNRQNTKVMG